jgi:hypothetical protein
VNLPALTTFSGDILQWQGFIDSLDAAIDSSLDNKPVEL